MQAVEWFDWTATRRPYQVLTLIDKTGMAPLLREPGKTVVHGCRRSCREMSVKSRDEQPLSLCFAARSRGELVETAASNAEEAGMTWNHHAYDLATHVLDRE